MEEVTLPAPPEGFEYTIRKKSIISVKIHRSSLQAVSNSILKG